MVYVFKNPRICPADNKGYIVKYEKCVKDPDEYDHLRYVGEKEEIFDEDEGDKAMKRLDELAGRKEDKNENNESEESY